ncbi:MAG: oligosaccharide flippase family protein [Lachnospiraceae bacterium]|nr:oligosaccharide flippase family protein [Lachnospiraceae bacterium]
MDDGRIKNSTRNMLAAIIYRIINLLFPFVINTIIIKTLGVEYLGLNMIFASILQILSITELGFGSALVFSMYEPIAKGDTAKVSALLRLYRNVYMVIGGIVFAGGMLCLPLLPKIVNGEVPNGISIYILFVISLVNSVIGYFLFAYRSSVIIAHQRKDITEKINILIEIALNCSKVLILLVTKNYYLFCILQPVYTIINCLLVAGASKRFFPQYKCEGTISKKEKKSIFTRVIGLAIHKFCNVVSRSFDNVIISWFLGIYILGKYNNYFVITNAVGLFIYIITVSVSSSVGNSLVCETKEKNFRDFNIIQLGFDMCLGWASICLVCLTQPFVKIWIGEELMFEDRTVIIFAVYLYAVVSSEVFMTYREAAGIWKHDRVRPFVEAGLNLLLNIVLVKIIGVDGVLISTIITMGIIRVIWGSYYLFKELFTGYSHVKYLLKQLLYLVITVIIGVITYIICSYINIEGIPGLLVKGVVCSFISIGLYLAVFFKTDEFKSLLNLAKGILKRK